MNFASLLLLTGLFAGSSASSSPASFRASVVSSARHYLSVTPPGPPKCTTYVHHVFLKVGVDVDGAPADMWDRAITLGTTHHRSRPSPGDIVFFDQTFDRNGNHRLDDPLTHVGVVLSVDEEGTITVAHGGATHGTGTFRMNLEHPDTLKGPDGQTWNSNLRVQRASDPPGTKYLASALWRGFATVSPEDAPGWAQ